MELENARSELFEISSKDKTTIRELNLNIRQLELSESYNNERLQSAENEERRLRSLLCSAENKTAELQNIVEALLDEVRTWKELLTEQQQENKDIQMKLDRALDLIQQNEMHLKNVMREYVDDKTRLKREAGDLNNKIKMLQSTEYQLQCELKESQTKENSLKLTADDLSTRLSATEQLHINSNEELVKERNRVDVLRGRINELEKTLDRNELERLELERLNQTLRKALNQADNEKVELLRQTTELHRERDNNVNEMNRLKDELRNTLDKAENATNKVSVLEEWLNETQVANENSERLFTDRLLSYEDNEKRIRQRLYELEREVSSINYRRMQ